MAMRGWAGMFREATGRKRRPCLSALLPGHFRWVIVGTQFWLLGRREQRVLTEEAVDKAQEVALSPGSWDQKLGCLVRSEVDWKAMVSSEGPPGACHGLPSWPG